MQVYRCANGADQSHRSGRGVANEARKLAAWYGAFKHTYSARLFTYAFSRGGGSSL